MEVESSMAFAAQRVTAAAAADKVFITNGDDFHSPAEEGGRAVCAVFGLVVVGLRGLPYMTSAGGGRKISNLCGKIK